MKYKGYEGVLEVDEEGKVLYGQVVGLRDVITFRGKTVAEARKAFEESVDDYLAFCQERGELPKKPDSGRLLLRIPPPTHRQLAQLAAAQNMSLNALVTAALQEKLAMARSTHLKSLSLHGRKAHPRTKARTPNAVGAKTMTRKQPLRKSGS
jgi:predicted HicB family RNase H-like nuclease